MEYDSEVDALVDVSVRRFGRAPKAPTVVNGAGFDLALKRFYREFPTAEAQDVLVDCYFKHFRKGELPDYEDDDRMKMAFRYWFQVIWPNLPVIRSDNRFRQFMEAVPEPKYSLGTLVHHLVYGYRGVVVSIDRTFKGTDEWYEEMARSRPPRNRPWYRVLVHDTIQMTYVAERHLRLDNEAEKVSHPLLDRFFSSFENGRYV